VLLRLRELAASVAPLHPQLQISELWESDDTDKDRTFWITRVYIGTEANPHCRSTRSSPPAILRLLVWSVNHVH
jgi:hypothetical protein